MLLPSVSINELNTLCSFLILVSQDEARRQHRCVLRCLEIGGGGGKEHRLVDSGQGIHFNMTFFLMLLLLSHTK